MVERLRSNRVSHKAKTVTDVSSEIVEGNTDRQYLVIQNQSTDTIVYITYNIPSVVGPPAIAIQAGGNYLIDDKIVWASVYAICDTGLTADISIVESSYNFYT